MDETLFTEEQKEIKKNGKFYLDFLLFAGVLLPVTAWIIEFSTRWCANEFFDPMPTWWHILLVSFVPISNFQTWWAIRNQKIERLGWLSFSNAIAIFISLYYAIIFAPITPFAVIGILFFLIGLLPLAPLFSLIAAILMRRQLNKIVTENKPFMLRWKGLPIALLLVLALVILAEIPITITKIGIYKANSEIVEEQNKGLQLLRNFGDKDYLLRLCYERSGLIGTDILTNLFTKRAVFADQKDENITKQAQKAIYRLTGKQYRQFPTPREIKNWDNFERWDLVDETDSSRINQGLFLVGSQIDGSVDGDAALGYLEWTLTFKNEKSWQQEAVSQIQLPPNAVVSRLTLWINGEEREAAFAKSAKVIEAYNAVTAKRRDPALVTLVGKDRIQLKCFPIEPNSQMKVRIGITTPLILENESKSLMLMPYFQERNFTVSAEHSIWIESKKQLEISNPNFVNENKGEVFAVRGKVNNTELGKIGSPIKIEKASEIKFAWAKDKNDSKVFIKQEIKESVNPKIGRYVFVVDTSLKMKEFQTEIAESIKKMAGDAEINLVLTNGNGLNLEAAKSESQIINSLQSSEIIKNADFEGGTDNAKAIEKAWELASQKENSAIIWIHSPQMIELSPTQNLIQLWTRRPGSSKVFSLQTVNGKDVVERVLNESNIVETIPRFGSLQEDLSKLLSELEQSRKTFVAVRSVENNLKILPNSGAKETSQHLVKLWANDEITRIMLAKDDSKAVHLAIKNQLVTQVSGAVVLETQQQYDQFGLNPVDTNTVPTIPEPEEYLLFAVILIICGWLFWKFRQKKLATA